MDFLSKIGFAHPRTPSIGQLLRNTTDMAMAPGVAMMATHCQLPRSGGGLIAESEMHAYYKACMRNRNLVPRIREFHNSTRGKVSRVWVVDCSAHRGELTANSPFTSEDSLFDFILSSQRRQKSSRIFLVDGITSWSAALIGSECKIPVEFFLDWADEHYVQLKSVEDSSGYSITMDNARIVPQLRAEGRSCLSFEALGGNEIQFTRSHIFFGHIPHRDLKTAVVMCNESNNEPLGSSLVNKFVSDTAKSERLCQDIHWLVWDVFHQMNDWTNILENTKAQLWIEEQNANHPELDLTKALHKDTAIHIELHEMLRVQMAIIEGFVHCVNSTNQHPPGSAISRVAEMETRLKRHQAVLDVLSKQTNNLISQVYNTMAIRESTSVGKLTWITLIYLPLSFAASVFSMNVKGFQPPPAMWIWMTFAMILLIVTLAAAIGLTSSFQHRQRIIGRFKAYIHSATSELEEICIDGGVGTDQERVATNARLCIKFPPKSEESKSSPPTRKKLQELLEELKTPVTSERPPPPLHTSVQKQKPENLQQLQRSGVIALDLALSSRQRKELGSPKISAALIV
ncbi:hypothetical protein FN846DRAFT_229095 [Sphaerosporella brunnea]|uniref:Cora-like Mg2+ transporter protein-domain-containing protein n=1 Tax=Sphaerosporella brunnea TaxID=1250544 RepID=A0A5J5ENK9_9PEZI|nr:hypothetical protein FN846DRAFT_229095 [Sphaerosporella brunnea]